MKMYFVNILALNMIVVLPNAYTSEARTIIATYDGKKFEMVRLPSDAESPQIEFSSVNERDIAAIMDWVLGLQKEKAIKTYNITVSDSEIENVINKSFGDKNEYVDETNKLLVKLAASLKEAKLNPDKSDEIYNRNLKGHMSTELWKKHLESNYSDEYISMLEKHIPFSHEDIDSSRNNVKTMLLEKKLIDRVVKEYSSTSSQQQAWESWCMRKIQEAEVLILDEHLKQEYSKKIKSIGINTLQDNIECPQSSYTGSVHTVESSS